MLNVNLRLFGGRGAGAGNGGGTVVKDTDGKGIRISNETDVWSERHKAEREAAADLVISATRDMNDEYGVMDNVETVTVAKMSNPFVMAFYAPSENKVVMNRAFMNVERTENTYKECVNSKFHPPLGKKSAIEAITAHELGHAIADKINESRKAKGINVDVNSQVVIDAFYKLNTKPMYDIEAKVKLSRARQNISGYAAKNYHETVAEAVADVYCNGGRAKKFSKAIVDELKKTIKNEL